MRPTCLVVLLLAACGVDHGAAPQAVHFQLTNQRNTVIYTPVAVGTVSRDGVDYTLVEGGCSASCDDCKQVECPAIAFVPTLLELAPGASVTQDWDGRAWTTDHCGSNFACDLWKGLASGTVTASTAFAASYTAPPGGPTSSVSGQVNGQLGADATVLETPFDYPTSATVAIVLH